MGTQTLGKSIYPLVLPHGFIPWFVSSQTNTIVATNHIQNLGMYVVKGLWGHKPWERVFIPWFCPMVSSLGLCLHKTILFIPWFVSSQTNTIVATNHIQNLGMYVVKRFVGTQTLGKRTQTLVVDKRKG